MSTCRMEGHAHAHATLAINGENAAMSVDLSSYERIEQLAQALNRALNTWDTAPAWLSDLCDMANAAREHRP